MNSRLTQSFARLLILGSAMLMTACAIPGMYMGQQADEAKIQSDGSVNGTAVALPDGSVVNFVGLSAAVLATLPHYVVPKGSAQEITPPYYDYKLGVGDVLRVTVWDHPELNNPGVSASTNATVTAADIAVASGSNDPIGRVVAADGTIYFPYVGTVRVVGMSRTAVRGMLARRLASYIKDPQLDVSITTYRSQKIYASGQVVRPGVATLGDVPITISDLISSAGGVTANGDLYHATLTRNGKQIPVDLYALLHGGDLSQNYQLVSGDMVNVPDNRNNKVYVLGEVIKPSTIIIPRSDYSLAEALTDAGGVNQTTSNSAQIYVIRYQSGGLANAYVLDARSPASLILADQFELRAHDIVFVDPAGITRFSRVITQIAPFLTGSNSAANTANIINKD